MVAATELSNRGPVDSAIGDFEHLHTPSSKAFPSPPEVTSRLAVFGVSTPRPRRAFDPWVEDAERKGDKCAWRRKVLICRWSPADG
jgi:hypothetical protein